MRDIPKKLYRFRSLDDALVDREISALTDSYLWSPKFPELNDPMEAYYELGDTADTILDLLVPRATSRLPHLYDQLDSILKSLCLISFGTTHIDSAMWAYYGSSHAGMCLEFDTELLALGDLRAEKLVDVTYSNSPLPKISFATLDNISYEVMARYVSHKRIEWAHENEWRFVTGSNGKKHYFEDALCRVFIGARAKSVHIDQILLALKKRPVEVVFCKISGFEMHFETIQRAQPLAASERVGAGIFEPERVLAYSEQNLRSFLSVPYEELLAECRRTALHPNAEEIQRIDIAGSDPNLLYFWTFYKLRSGREVHDGRYFDRQMRLVKRDLAKP